jgi:hypothetical protein
MQASAESPNSVTKTVFSGFVMFCLRCCPPTLKVGNDIGEFDYKRIHSRGVRAAKNEREFTEFNFC